MLAPRSVDGAPTGNSGKLPAWRRALPFVVGTALVAYIATRIDFAAFATALRRTNYVAFSAAALAYCVALLFADTLATTHVYRRTVGRVRFPEILVIRAASYLPGMVNHHVGQAWLTYFVSRKYRASMARTAGATLLVYATMLAALFAFVLVGLMQGHAGVPWLPPIAALVLAGAGIYALALVARPRVLADQAVMAPLFEAGLTGHLVETAWRAPHVVIQFLGTWVPLLFFGVDVPLYDALALMPIIVFVVTLPVTPQGVGTREALSISLLSAYARGNAAERASAITAATMSWLAIVALIQLALAMTVMRRANALLGRDQRGAGYAGVPG
jgi:Lysylphosphatidylglycerol synthase TM region